MENNWILYSLSCICVHHLLLSLPDFRDGRRSNIQICSFLSIFFPPDNSHEDGDLWLGVVNTSEQTESLKSQPCAFVAEHATRKFRTAVLWSEPLGKRALSKHYMRCDYSTTMFFCFQGGFGETARQLRTFEFVPPGAKA